LRIFDKITEFYRNESPFVVYRKPNSEMISGFFMRDKLMYNTDDFSKSGFVFAPFNADEKAILFPLENSELISEELEFNETQSEEKEFSVDETAKGFHIKLVEKAIDEINIKKFKKVVISRKEEIQLENFELLEIYKKLLQNYKNAFVYVWFHPKVGLWLGATPETLVQIENSSFKTMSLAGTQVYKDTDEVTWKTKELEEQQLVTDFIKNQVKDISTDLHIDKTETVRAGNLLHLKTKVTGKLGRKSNLKQLIRALHPTPAVCGLPRNNAKDFILKNENYHRSFYTGFLGEINMEDKNLNSKNSSLFVNLRCMEIRNEKASIYVGGGITKDSVAKKEWEETVSKSKTMKKVL
jgi:isochorismate synthase